jgi:hypothetical protein
MSQENVELFRKAIQDYNRRDIEAMLVIWHPEAEWYPFTASVEGDDAYHGHEGLRRWWANVDATFEEIGWLTRYRDGLGVWGRAYQSHAEALEAAGLRE